MMYRIQNAEGKFFRSSTQRPPYARRDKDNAFGPKGKFWSSKSAMLEELERAFTRYEGAMTKVVEYPPGLSIVSYDLVEVERESL